MIEMSVCEENLIEPLESGAGAQNLPLSAFAAVHQESKFFVLN
jgi:hypothetical protein